MILHLKHTDRRQVTHLIAEAQSYLQRVTGAHAELAYFHRCGCVTIGTEPIGAAVNRGCCVERKRLADVKRITAGLAQMDQYFEGRQH